MKFAVQSFSQGVADPEVERMVEACSLQLVRDVALSWNRLPPEVHFFTKLEQVPVDYVQVVIFDDADMATALGYHAVRPDGGLFGRVFVKPVLESGGGLFSSPCSVSSVLSHELCETFVDPYTNDWSDGVILVDGKAYFQVAKELCDPVEAQGYYVAVDGFEVYVSDFVLPAYFSGIEQGPYDFMDTLKAPLSLGPGGYMVARDSAGAAKNVFGAISPPVWRLATKAHRASRTARRLGTI